MLKKIIHVIPILILLFVTTGCSKTAPTNRQSSKFEQDTVLYKSPTNHFSIRVPKTWSLSEVNPALGSMEGYENIANNFAPNEFGYAVHLDMSNEPSSSDKSFEDFARYTTESDKNNKNFNKTVENVMIDSKPAFIVTETSPFRKRGFLTTYLKAIINVDNKKYYTVSLFTLADDYKINEKLYRDVVSSFDLE